MTKKTTKLESPDLILAQIRRRYLHVTDVIVKKNRENGVKPDSERNLSELIGSDSNAISKMKGGRNPTVIQIWAVGNHFNLDFNYFFRELLPRYELYNQNIFLIEKNDELIVRMKERFGEETARFQHVITTFREEIQRLESENGDSIIVKQSKKMLDEASEKIKEAFFTIPA